MLYQICVLTLSCFIPTGIDKSTNALQEMKNKIDKIEIGITYDELRKSLDNTSGKLIEVSEDHRFKVEIHFQRMIGNRRYATIVLICVLGPDGRLLEKNIDMTLIEQWISKKQFESVQVGMSAEKITRILGQPGSVLDLNDEECWRYEICNCDIEQPVLFVRVHFSNGKVISKESYLR